MRTILAACAVALTISAASGHVAAAPPAAWFVARSAHFEVYASGSPARAASALAMFEDARAFFTSYFSLGDSARPPVRVLVFSGAKEFAPYRTNESGDAFYQPARDRDYIALKDFDGDAFHIVAHEYAHAALGLKGLDLPPWLSEGLAEFFSSVSIVKDKARLGGAPNGRLAALRPASLMTVPQLLAVTRRSEAYNNNGHAGLFYAESWALTHMLMVDPRYRSGAPKFIALAQSGIDVADALTQVFGKSTADVERDLRTYITRGYYEFFTIDYAPPASRAATASPSSVSTFDAQLVIADMMAAQIGKDLETRAMLDALEREQPAHLMLIETRAFFELRARGAAASEPYFKRAIDAGSRNPTVLAEYALRIGARDPARASALLEDALRLAPSDTEIRIHSAAMLIRTDKPDDAMARIAPITHVPSDMEFEYYQIVANAHAMAGDFDLAAAAAARVVAAAATPEQVAFASTFLTTAGGPPDMSKVVEGRMKNLHCDAAHPVMEVTTSAGVIKLTIDDPALIMIAGKSGGNLDLDCGEQDIPLRVGYSEKSPPDGTIGRVRFLDFRKKTGAF